MHALHRRKKNASATLWPWRRRSRSCKQPVAREGSARPGAMFFDALEPRVLFSAAFDLIGLTALRADPDFADIDGTGVSVAVIDTGVDFTHNLLAPNFVAGADIVFGGDTPTPTADHGTHVAGIIGATDPEIGVATDVGLIGLQVFTPVPGQSPVAFNRNIEAALQWVLSHRVEFNIVAVNMSLGGGFFESQAQAGTPIYLDEILALEDAGVTVVSAAGNSYGIMQDPTSGQTFNAMFPNSGAPGIFSTLDVGAVWEENEGNNIILGEALDVTTAGDRITGFSQRPPTDVGNAIFAPGALINSTIPGNRLAELAGTSMASPMVAGAVALLQEAALKFGGRLLEPAEVRDILQMTGDAIFDGDDEDSVAFVDANGDNIISNSELVPFNFTNTTYSRLNVYDAVREVRARFEENAPATGGAGTGDSNGTIAGAYIGPRLDGSPASGLRARIGFDQQANIGATDVDMYRFEVLSPGMVTIEVGSDNISPQDFDSVLRLFNSQGTQLAINDDIQPGVNSFSRITMELQPGTYFAGVSGFGNATYNPLVAASGQAGATGNYRIDFTLSNDDPNGLISGAVAVNLGGGGVPEFFAGFIGADYGQPVGVADVDLFRVVIPDDGVLLVDIDTPFNNGEFVDSFLRVFDANGNELAVSDDDLAIDISGNPTEFTDPLFSTLVFEDPVDRQFFDGHTTDSFLAVSVTRGQVFYVGVSDFFNSQYNPTNLSNRPAIGTGGNYNLTLAFYNNDLNGSIPQAVDASAVALPIVNQPGAIGTDGISGGGEQQVGDRDVDMVRIRPATDGILEVDIDSYSIFDAADAVDTVLYIFDANGNYLAGNDDTDGLDPLVRLQVQAGVDYFVAVAGYGNENFDPFQLGSGSAGDTGNYRFNARLLSSDTLFELANNGTDFGGVVELHDGESISEFIGSDNGLVIGPGDVDFFSFTAAANAMIEVATRALSDFSADTFLRVFDAQGDEIAFNDNAAPGTLASSVTFAAEAGKTYSIGVSSAGPEARTYDPATGEGAPTASEGDYAISLMVEVAPVPEMDVQGNGVTILTGDVTPTEVDDTDFGSVTIGAQPITHTFTIANLGDADLNLTGNPIVSISGDAASLADFMVTQPASTVVAATGSLTFDITFMPIGSAGGTRTATISIASDDADENPYTFDVAAVSVVEAVPDVKVTGMGLNIADGDDTPSADDGTLFDAVPVGQQAVHDFILTNVGTANLSFDGLSVLDAMGDPSTEFTVTAVAGDQSFETILRVTFAPTAGGDHRGTVTFTNNDPDENPFTFDVLGAGIDRMAVATFGQSLGLTKLERDDDFGNTFQFTLTGAGQATLFREADGRLSIELAGTDDRSKLTIKPKVATDAAIDTIAGDGPVSSINGKGVAILGDMIIVGRVGSLTLGNVDSQHTLALGGAATDKPINVTLGVLTDVTFTSTAPVQRFAATSIVDSDNATDTITAPRIGTLQVKGDKQTLAQLESDITITGEAVLGRALDKLYVNGPVDDVTVTIAGEAGSVVFKDMVSHVALSVSGAAGAIDMRGSIDDLAVAVDGALRSIKLGDVSAADVSAGSTGSVSAVRWLDGALALIDAKSIKTTGDRKTATPGDFGPDVTINADSDSLAKQTLGNARIADTLSGQWLITGPVGAIAAGAVTDAFNAQVNGEVKSLTSKAQFDGFAAAFAFGKVDVKQSMTGATIIAGSQAGDPNAPVGNYIKSFKVGGDIAGGTLVLVGVDGFDADGPFKVGAEHFIKSMSVKGDAAGDSVFRAGAFPKSVSINKVKVDPTGDARFVVSE